MADREQNHARASTCPECGAALAADQRYCLSCGARRGALPEPVLGMLAGLHERGPTPPPPELAEPPVRSDSGPFPRLPGPQALAAILLAALGFGVLAGSLAPAPLGNLVSAPLSILVHLPPSSSASSSQSADASGGDSGGAAAAPTQTQQTITVTTPAPATPAPLAQTPTPAVTPPTTTTPSGNSNSGGLLGLPPIKHVFLIVLADQGYSQTFSPTSGDTYLSRTLPKQGELIEDYYGVAGSSLANGIALISGQGPTALTDFNCPQYAPITGATKGTEGQVVGSGCVYPKTTQTIADELAAKKLTWRAYVDGIGAPCRHPMLGATDPDYTPTSLTDPYVTWRNPFVYFRSVIAKPTCITNVVDLGQLTQDVSSAQTAPSFSYIVPSACEDGDATPCQTGAPAGLAPADAFLRKVVPEIKRSPAYKDGGLIAITFDHAPQGGPYADANACCATPPYPNLPAPTPSTGTTTTGTTTTPTTSTGTTTTPTTSTGTTTTPPPNPGDVPGQTTPTGGGGQVGLVLLSAYVKPSTVESIDYYNHFSLLGTIESIFGLKRLGFASDSSLPLFDAVIFNRKP